VIVNNIIIIGGGFSALISYLKYEKYNPLIISPKKSFFINSTYLKRKNLNINKFFSYKSNSQGIFKFNLHKNTKLHDRLTFGGNSNIWGGFINSSLIPDELKKKLNYLGINLEKLEISKNGYLSNQSYLRQLRDKNNKILDASDFINNFIEGFVCDLEINNQFIKVNYYSEKEKSTTSLSASKILFAVSFPQLIEILFKSDMLKRNAILKLDEFDHYFKFNTNSKISDNFNNNNVLVKYDFLRILKHFFGYQHSLDNFSIKLPVFVDQVYLNKKKELKLELDIDQKTINQISFKKFGDSIHYCNLYIDNQNISKYLENFSKRLFGVSMPFVNQNEPGPISNDIIRNIWDEL
tara:strand:+ start:406 stop:1458 length:1053 start_codon:yes stop_codon:yes gene_type:complete